MQVISRIFDFFFKNCIEYAHKTIVWSRGIILLKKSAIYHHDYWTLPLRAPYRECWCRSQARPYQVRESRCWKRSSWIVILMFSNKTIQNESKWLHSMLHGVTLWLLRNPDFLRTRVKPDCMSNNAQPTEIAEMILTANIVRDRRAKPRQPMATMMDKISFTKLDLWCEL